MKCNKCSLELASEVAIKCSACQDKLHYMCAGLSEADYKKILPMNLKKWKCTNCKQVKKASTPSQALCSPKPALFLNEAGDSHDNHPSIISIDTGALLKNMNSQFQQLSQDMAELKNSFNSKLDALAVTIQAWSNKFEELEINVRNMQAQVTAVKEENTLLRTQMDDLKRNMEDQEQKARQCNIEIQNLPEKSSENLIHIALTMGKVLGVPISIDSVKAVHRVPHREQTGRAKNVILELTSRRLRDDVIAAARARRGVTAGQLLTAAEGAAAGAGTSRLDDRIASQPVFINEHLTLKNKILYSNTRKIARDKQYKWVWIKNASILVRKADNTKVIRIRNDDDLDKL